MAYPIFGRYGAGKNLWDAIITPYQRGSYDPPIVMDWINSQAEAYLDIEWDNDWIEKLVWQLKNEKVIVYLDKIGQSIYELNRTKLADITEKTPPFYKKAMEELYQLYLDSDQKRREWANERASDDYQSQIADVNLEDNEAVAMFFGIEKKDYELSGYRIDGCDYDLDKVYICPDCGEVIPSESMVDDWDRYHDEKALETQFQCPQCDCVCSFVNPQFMKANTHFKELDLLSKAV